MEADQCSSRRYGETRTGLGQAVEFTCPSDQYDKVIDFFKNNICTVDIPTTGRVYISHGGLGRYTRYNITQHKYAGGGHDESGNGGYIEVLEIANPPGERCGIVIHEYNTYHGSVFSEWQTVNDAMEAFSKHWCSRDTRSKLPKLKGFKRYVECAALTPWFYAIGDEELIGDFTFPEGFQDDPVYRFNRKFVVLDKEGIPSVKTCMGARYIKRKNSEVPFTEYQYRIVYWDDGSIWDESGNDTWWATNYGNPRPLEDSELWITEAIKQFRELLAGKSTEFTINFTDGNKFVGRLKRDNSKTPCTEGNYELAVHVKGVKEPLRGWVEFKPTTQAPDIVQYVKRKFASSNREIERIQVLKRKTKAGGKKWSGAFLCH